MNIDNNQVTIEIKKKREEVFTLKKRIERSIKNLKNVKGKLCEINNAKEENIDLKEKVATYSNGLELPCDGLDKYQKCCNGCNKKCLNFDKT